MSKSDDEISELIENQLQEASERSGYNAYYIDEYTMAAATKAAVIFQALGITYGDRIPDVYKINDTLKELVTSVIERDTEWVSSGGFRVSRKIYTDSPDNAEFTIMLELAEFGEHRILNDD